MRYKLTQSEVLELRAKNYTWAEVGRELARRHGRVMPYTARAVQRVGLLRSPGVVQEGR